SAASPAASLALTVASVPLESRDSSRFAYLACRSLSIFDFVCFSLFESKLLNGSQSAKLPSELFSYADSRRTQRTPARSRTRHGGPPPRPRRRRYGKDARYYLPGRAPD